MGKRSRSIGVSIAVAVIGIMIMSGTVWDAGVDAVALRPSLLALKKTKAERLAADANTIKERFLSTPSTESLFKELSQDQSAIEQMFYMSAMLKLYRDVRKTFSRGKLPKALEDSLQQMWLVVLPQSVDVHGTKERLGFLRQRVKEGLAGAARSIAGKVAQINTMRGTKKEKLLVLEDITRQAADVYRAVDAVFGRNVELPVDNGALQASLQSMWKAIFFLTKKEATDTTWRRFFRHFGVSPSTRSYTLQDEPMSVSGSESMLWRTAQPDDGKVVKISRVFLRTRLEENQTRFLSAQDVKHAQKMYKQLKRLDPDQKSLAYGRKPKFVRVGNGNEFASITVMDELQGDAATHFFFPQDLDGVVRVSPENRAQAFKHLIEALKRLHAANLVHGDVKWENLFWSRVKRRWLLGDFGNLQVPGSLSKKEWTLPMAPPEYFLRVAQKETMTAPRDFATDAWAAGICLQEITARQSVGSLFGTVELILSKFPDRASQKEKCKFPDRASQKEKCKFPDRASQKEKCKFPDRASQKEKCKFPDRASQKEKCKFPDRASQKEKCKFPDRASQKEKCKFPDRASQKEKCKFPDRASQKEKCKFPDRASQKEKCKNLGTVPYYMRSWLQQYRDKRNAAQDDPYELVEERLLGTQAHPSAHAVGGLLDLNPATRMNILKKMTPELLAEIEQALARGKAKTKTDTSPRAAGTH